MSEPESLDSEFDQFRDRVDAYCADLIEPDDLRALEVELLASDLARRYFVEYLRLHAELGFAIRASRAASVALNRFQAIDGERPFPGGLKPISGPTSPRWRRFSKVRRLEILAGLAASVALVGVGLAVVPRGGWTQSLATPTSATEVSIPASMPVAGGNVAWLINAQDCRWTDPGETPGRDMIAGKFLRLESGLAEVEFDLGARVILQGPATLELLSGNMARLVRGSMTARVPTRAHGFTIYSPQGKIVDLGTEFGLAVDNAGSTSVRVFSGELTAAVGRGSNGPVRLSRGQQAQIVGQSVRVETTPNDRPPHVFTRAIVPPPEILARTLLLDFSQPVSRSILDAEGLGVGLTRRLPGTGAALLDRDRNLRLRTDLGALELTTTRSDLNGQAGLDLGEYLGVALKDLGFTGTEDFSIRAEIPNIPTLDVVGQFGLYAGIRSDRAIRGGVLRQPTADQYELFLVNNVDGLDANINEVGLTTTGDDLRFILRRVAGSYSFSVENLTRKSTNTLTIAPSPFLDSTADLDVGLFGANAQSDVRKTLKIKQVEVTVYTLVPAPTTLARWMDRDATIFAH